MSILIRVVVMYTWTRIYVNGILIIILDVCSDIQVVYLAHYVVVAKLHISDEVCRQPVVQVTKTEHECKWIVLRKLIGKTEVIWVVFKLNTEWEGNR